MSDVNNFKESKSKLLFEYSIPISERFTEDNEFLIKGIAINETTTSNGHKFIAEELQKSASTLIGVPLLKDHVNSVDSIVGRVKHADFDSNMKNIPFTAKVNDKKIQELISRGDLNTVSIGASCDPKDIEELEDGTIIPRNITFKELSLVAVPADQNATFGVALMEAYSKIKSHSTDVENIESKGGIEMETEKLPMKESDVDETEETEVDEEEILDEKLKKARIEAKKKELAKLEQSLKETIVEKPKVESVVEKVDEAEEVEVESKYSFVQGAGSLKGSSVTLVREKY